MNEPEDQNPQEQLQYWHTEEKRTSPVLLTFLVLVGVPVGFVVVLLLTIACGFGIAAAGNQNIGRWVGGLSAAFLIGILIVSVVVLIRFAIAEGRKAPGIPKSPQRFFLIGILLGLGLAGLLGGLCFTAITVSG